jgi:O-antigen/teichoic acid export membrane protein
LEPEIEAAAVGGEADAEGSVARGVGAVAVPLVGGLILSFAVSLAVARWLGAAQFGTYAYVSSWVVVLGAIAVFGLENTIVSQVPIHVAASAWAVVRGLTRWATALVLLVTLALAALGLLVRSLVVADGRSPSITLWLIAGALVGLTALLRVQQSLLRALHRAALSQVPASVLLPVVVLALVGLFVQVGTVAPTATNALLALVAATATALAVAAWLVVRSLPRDARTVDPQYRHREWARIGSRMFLLTLLASLNNRIGILILGAMTVPAAVGAYSVAVRGVSFVPFAMDVAVIALAPSMATAYGAGQIDRVRRLGGQVRWIALLAGLPIALALTLWGGTFLALFGPGFETAATALAILALGEVANIGAGPVATMLLMTGHERDAVVGLAIGAASNAALCLILIPTFGINGAAVGAVAGVLLWNAVLWRFVRRHLAASPTTRGGGESAGEPTVA